MSTAPSPQNGKVGPIRTTCARALSRAAELIEEEAPPERVPVIREDKPSTAFAYDADLPPDIPPGESLADWGHEQALRRHPHADTPRSRLARRIRRAARRLDGRVIDTRTLPLG